MVLAPIIASTLTTSCDQGMMPTRDLFGSTIDAAFAWKRQICERGLRVYRTNEKTDFVVDLRRVRDGLGNVLAETALELAPQPVHRGFRGAFARSQPVRDGGIPPGRRLPEQRGLQLVELRGATVRLPLLPQLTEHAIDQREGPAPFVERFGRRRFDRLESISVLRLVERERQQRHSPPALERLTARGIVGEEVFQRGEQERPKAA